MDLLYMLLLSFIVFSSLGIWGYCRKETIVFFSALWYLVCAIYSAIYTGASYLPNPFQRPGSVPGLCRELGSQLWHISSFLFSWMCWIAEAVQFLMDQYRKRSEMSAETKKAFIQQEETEKLTANMEANHAKQMAHQKEGYEDNDRFLKREISLKDNKITQLEDQVALLTARNYQPPKTYQFPSPMPSSPSTANFFNATLAADTTVGQRRRLIHHATDLSTENNRLKANEGWFTEKIAKLEAEAENMRQEMLAMGRDIKSSAIYKEAGKKIETLNGRVNEQEELMGSVCESLQNVMVHLGVNKENAIVDPSTLAKFMKDDLPDIAKTWHGANQAILDAEKAVWKKATELAKENEDKIIKEANRKHQVIVTNKDNEHSKIVTDHAATISQQEQTIRDMEACVTQLETNLEAATKTNDDLNEKLKDLEAKFKVNAAPVANINHENTTIKKLQDDLEAMTKERDNEHKALMVKSTELIKEKKKNQTESLHESDKNAVAVVEELWPGQDLEVEGATLAFVAKVKTCVEYDRAKHRIDLANSKKVIANVRAERDCRDCKDKQDLFNYYESLSRVYGDIAEVVKTECDDKALMRKAPWMNMQTGDFYPLESYTTMEQFHGEKIVNDLLTRFSAMKRHVKLMIHSSAFTDSTEIRDILRRTKNLVFVLHNAVGRPHEPDSDDEEEEEEYWSEEEEEEDDRNDYALERGSDDDEYDDDEGEEEDDSEDEMPVGSGGGWGNYDPNSDNRPLPQTPTSNYPPLP